MTKCLNCGAEISQTPGRRPRKFCDNKGKCRLAHWNKSNPKQGKYVLKTTHEKIVKQLSDKLNESVNKQFEKESDSLVKALENKATAKTKGIVATVAPESTAKHPLYKEGDPKEGSMAFYMKYDCYTYEERK